MDPKKINNQTLTAFGIGAEQNHTLIDRRRIPSRFFFNNPGG